MDFGFSCFGATDEDLVELPFTEKWSAPEWDGGEFPIWQAKKADIYTFTLVCKWVLECKLDGDSNQSDDSCQPCVRKYLQEMFELGLDRDSTRRPGNIKDVLVFLDKASNNIYHNKTSVSALTPSKAISWMHEVPDLRRDFMNFQIIHFLVRKHIVKGLTKRYNEKFPACETKVSYQLALSFEIAFGVPRNKNQSQKWLKASGKTVEDLEETLNSLSRRAFQQRFESHQLVEFYYGPLVPEYASKGLIQAAMESYKFEKEGKSNRPETAYLLQNNLANLYLYNRDWKEAEKITRNLLNAQISTIGSGGDEDTLSTMDTLADILFHYGSTTEAISIQDDVVIKSIRRYGLKHQRTLISLHQLSNFWADEDMFDHAISLQREVIAILETTIGKGHEKVILTMNNLTSKLRRCGALDDALELGKETLQRCRSFLGSHSEHIPATMLNLANVHYDIGDFAVAILLYEQAYNYSRLKYGESHLISLACAESIAKAIFGAAEDRIQEAITMQKWNFKAYKKVHGLGHPSTLPALETLVSMIPDTTECRKLCLDFLQDQKCVLRNDDPEISKAIFSIIQIMQERVFVAESLNLRREYVERQVKLYGEKHMSSHHALEGLAVELYLHDEHSLEALTVQRRVVSLNNDIPDLGILKHLTSLSNLVRMLESHGNEREARDFRQIVIDLSLSEARQIGSLSNPEVYEVLDVAIELLSDTGDEKNKLELEAECRRLERSQPEEPFGYGSLMEKLLEEASREDILMKTLDSPFESTPIRPMSLINCRSYQDGIGSCEVVLKLLSASLLVGGLYLVLDNSRTHTP